MNAYRPKTPRFALGVAAMAVTSATIGLLALAPAQMNFRSQQVPVVALSDTAAQTVADVAPSGNIVESIDVRATRGTHLVTVIESHRMSQNRLRG